MVLVLSKWFVPCVTRVGILLRHLVPAQDHLYGLG